MERPVLAHNGTSKLHKTGRGDRGEGAAMTGGAKSPGYQQKSRIKYSLILSVEIPKDENTQDPLGLPYCRVLKPTLNRSRSRIEADVFDVVSGTVAGLEYKPRLVNG